MKPIAGRRTLLVLAFVPAAMLAARHASAQTLTLGEAAEAALASHPAIAASGARAEGAREALAAARATRLPGLRLDASMTHFQEPMIVAPLHSLDLTTPPRFDETLVQGRLGLAYTLFDGGERSSRIEAAAAMSEAATSGGRVDAMELLEEVTDAYLSVATARAVRDAALAQTAAFQEERNRAERRLEAGTAARVELLRAGASLQDARAQLVGAEARVSLTERNLARLMGVAAETVAGRDIADISLPDPDLTAADAGRSPMVERAARALAAAEARAGEERAGRMPRVDAGAGLLDYGTLTGEHVFEWQAGLQLSWPLFTGGARSASVRRAEADVREAEAELARVELRVEAAVDAATTAVEEADARIEALEAAVVQWAEVARIEALALESGSGVQGDLLRAEAGLFQARAALARAGADAGRARVALARARGVLDTSWLNREPEDGR